MMHEEQPRYYDPRPCPATNYRRDSDRNVDMIGLAKAPHTSPIARDPGGIG